MNPGTEITSLFFVHFMNPSSSFFLFFTPQNCVSASLFCVILKARRPGGADLFICYAGVQLRETVAAKSDWLVFDFEELLTHLTA